MSLRIGLLLVTYLISASAWASPSGICERATLARVLAQADEQRAAEEWREVLDYKNTPRKKPVTYEIDAYELARAHPAYKSKSDIASRSKGKRSQYEDAVLHLKKGDTVVIGKRRFHLGEFLGAGNTTHIFAIAGTDQAVRIPFIADFLHETAPATRASDPQFARVERILTYSKAYSEAVQSATDAVTLIEIDPDGRFQVVERIHGTQTGAHLISHLLGPAAQGSAELPLTWTGDRFERLPTAIEAEDLDKMNALISVMRRNGDATSYGGKYEFRRGSARQYLYDTVKKRWFLIDKDG